MAQPTDASLGIPSKGTLKKTSFARILRHIARSKSTGALYLLSGKTKKVVFFEDGAPSFVRSNLVAECLGQVLVRDGLITSKQCEQTLETMRRTGKQQGRLLVELGIISEGNLRYGLEAQMRQKLFDIFTWDDGRFQFKPQEEGVPNDAGARLTLSPAAVIVSGILETASEESAREELREVGDHYPIRRGGEPEDLELLPVERFFLESMDGSRTISELLDRAIDPAPPACASLLHALVQSGLCQLSRLPRPPRMQPAKPVDASTMADAVFLPAMTVASTITEFEDTPIPGQLPWRKPSEQADEVLDDTGNPAHSLSITLSGSNSPGTGAEPTEEIDDTFAEEVVLLEDDELEVIDDTPSSRAQLTYQDDSTLEASLSASSDPFLLVHRAPESALIALNDRAALSAIELPGDLSLEGAPSLDDLFPRNTESAKALAEFYRGREATERENWLEAIQALENAFELGVDIAELHARLAWARFRASGDDSAVAEHALELLDYAQSLDAELDLIAAYRGMVLRAEGDNKGARRELERAIRLNPSLRMASEGLARIPAR
jgi:hypothetical protein